MADRMSLSVGGTFGLPTADEVKSVNLVMI